MRRALSVLLALAWVPGILGAATQDLGRLPDWARKAVEASRSVPAPPDAEAWVLLDRTEVAYTGDGEIRVHRYRVVQVLGERGTDEAVYLLSGTGAATSKVKKLKGWNLRPDGELVKLDKDDVASSEGEVDGQGSYSTTTYTAGVLPRAAKGSYLAFESLEVRQEPLGPLDVLSPMEDVPVLSWQCAAAKREGWFNDLKAVDLHLDLAHFEDWGLHPLTAPGSVEVRDVPAAPKAEPFRPDGFDLWPRVQVRFLDPASAPKYPDWTSWNGLAAFTARAFPAEDGAGLPGPASAGTAKTRLEDALSWMDRHLQYRQVYLSPSRGWVPEQVAETSRKRFGDCKDFAAYFLALARRAGLQGAPVLARINGGHMAPTLPPGVGFNHAIAAVRLETSLGLPAEVVTPAGRFLLVDPTDHFTPLGWLGTQHRGKWLMICLPDQAVWVQAPEGAIRQDGLDLAFQGKMDATRVLGGTLRLSEVQNAADLRRKATEETGKDLLEALRSVLGLPTGATCELVRHSDAFDLEKPFEVELRISVPDAMNVDSEEYDLDLPGFPGIPSRPTVNGRPRHYPLEKDADLRWTYQATIEMPREVSPLSPSLKLSTGLRDIDWTAQATGSKVTCSLRMVLKEACFGPQSLEAGVKAFTADRAAVLKLHQDGLAFKIQP
ncbi:MAG TPA: transglutaminase domain-containing protein [Holophagaceae bacterium]|nr:transglutaminase domain-containing protein [Holophagaceae bacterium]